MFQNTYRSYSQFVSTLLPTILCVLLCIPCFSSSADAGEAIIDYPLQSAIYQWYGKLDSGITPRELMPEPQQIDFAEYPLALPSRSAHHILNIKTIRAETNVSEVEVTAEFQTWQANVTDNAGHYLMQTLIINANGQVLSSQTKLDETDDFMSRYREASDTNLLRALLYRWTHTLDMASPAGLNTMLTSDALFSGPEPQMTNASQYLHYLRTLNHNNSRRVIKNLNIRPGSAAGAYQVDFEYQWTAINMDGDTEQALIGISMRVVVANGEALVQFYQARYLPPVTDLGAEIRC